MLNWFDLIIDLDNGHDYLLIIHAVGSIVHLGGPQTG